MSIRRAKTPEEYVELIDQAIFEIEELRIAAAYDMDDLGASMAFVDTLEEEVRELRKSMEEGRYAFANRDLPFMEIVNKYDNDMLPFRYLLRVINETHRKGLDVEEN